MKVRLHGTREEVAEATRRLVEVLDVVAVSEPYPGPGPAGQAFEEGAAMRVVIVARHGSNQQSGLELDRAYRVHASPDERGAVLVFDDTTTSFRWVTPGEYREVPDPLDRHDLVRIEQGPGGYQPICSCVWRCHRGWPDPDEAAHIHGVHQRHMHVQRRLLTQPVPPQLLAWIQQLRAQRRDQEPEQ